MEIITKKIFNQRIDFYGQSLAAYLAVLIVFLIFYGTFEDGNFTLTIISPILILMLVIVFATTILLLGASIRRKKIIIDEKSITFANRFRKREFNFGEIESIRIRKSPAKVVKNDARFVSIKIKNRKKAILVRTASFSDDKILLDYFLQIKQKIQNI